MYKKYHFTIAIKLFVSFALFLLIERGNCQCVEPLHPDYHALIKLYQATKGDSWTNNTGWKDGVAGTKCDPCTNWFGVTCTNNRVTKIELIMNKLDGNIPSEFAQLSNLVHLDLRSNSIKGNFPISFTQLENLTFLNLFRNGFSGNLPPEIGNMKKLKSIYLTLNNFTGLVPIEISNMTALEILNFKSNKFSGEILDKLVALPEINSIDISNNNFTGIIPQALAAKPKLNDLRISFNKFYGTIPGELGEVLNLFLDNNNLSGCIDPDFFTQCTMPNRSINNNPLLPWKGDLVEYCKTTGKIEEQVGAPCKDPRFSFNQKINENCECAGDCGHPDFLPLMEFYLATGGNSWFKKNGWNNDYTTNCNPCMWKGITCDSNGRVKTISLIENNVVGTIPSSITKLSHLESLILPNNKIQGLNPALFKIPNIKVISLGGNPLNSTIPSDIQHAKMLTELELTGCNLLGELPYEITELSNLKSLSLHGNMLVGKLPDSLTKLTALEKLHLTANRFSGPFLQDIGKLINLREIRIENNEFSGPLPEQLPDLPNLVFAWFENNNFEGCIPEGYKIFCPTIHKVRYANNPNLSWNGSNQDFCNTSGSSQSQEGARCRVSGTIENCQCIEDNRACFDPKEVLCLEWLKDTLSNRMCGGTPNWYNYQSVSQSTLNDEAVIIINTAYKIVSEVGSRIEVFTCLGERLEDCSYSLGIGCSDTSIVHSLTPWVQIYSCQHDTLPSDCSNMIHPDYPLLMKLYSQTNGYQWLNNGGWAEAIFDSISNPCQWYGVHCNNLNRVDSLDLNHNNLVGEIDIDFGKVPYLLHLDLSYNKLFGTISEGIFKASSLKSLVLANNNLSGSISQSLVNLKNLTHINFEDNMLEGDLAAIFDSLTHLSYINLSNNIFTGSLPALETNNLNTVLLHNNKFSGCIPPNYTNLCGKNVDLSENFALPWYGDFAKLCATDGSTESQINTPCNDSDSLTIDDTITANCQCLGSIPSSIDDLLISNNIMIYPNPCSEYVNINSLNNAVISNITFYNVVGTKLPVDKLQNSISWDISRFPSGNYFISVDTNFGNKVLRFVKL